MAAVRSANFSIAAHRRYTALMRRRRLTTAKQGVGGLKLGALCKEGTMEENWSNLSLPHGKVEAVTLTEVKDALFRDEVQ